MKKILFLLLIISTNTFSQQIGATKDIADIVLPNPEVQLFYGNVAYSASNIVILPHHIIVYSPQKATFHLLDKESRLELDKISLFDIEHIVTHRVNYGEKINGKFRTIKKYKTPYSNYSLFNKIKMYSLSDTSVYGGTIRIKRKYKLLELFVQNDSLKLNFIDFNPKKLFKPVSKKEKRKKIKFDKQNAIQFSNYLEFKNKQFWLYSRSPYINKKLIHYKENNTRYFRDSILNFNTIFYKNKKDTLLKVLYQNSYSDISKIIPKEKNGYWIFPDFFKSNNKLVLYLGESIDSIIVFNKNLDRVFQTQLIAEIKKAFPNKYIKTKYSGIQIFKDEFTEKLYIIFPSKKGNTITELLIDESSQKINFRFLRTYKYKGSWLQAISVNKGILYFKTKNDIVGKDYVYQFDLYKNLDKKDSLLEIKFKTVNKQLKTKKNWNRSFLEYENYSPLSKKLRKKYFKKIKRDTIIYPQNTYLNVLKSIQKAIENDSISYALSFLQSYNALEKLEMRDDIKAKNFVYFDLLTEFYEKDRALNQIQYFIEGFDTFDRQMYKNKMIVKTPDGFIFELLIFDKQWYLGSVIKKITIQKTQD